MVAVFCVVASFVVGVGGVLLCYHCRQPPRPKTTTTVPGNFLHATGGTGGTNDTDTETDSILDGTDVNNESVLSSGSM